MANKIITGLAKYNLWCRFVSTEGYAASFEESAYAQNIFTRVELHTHTQPHTTMTMSKWNTEIIIIRLTKRKER